jgi:hypothetical protein
MTQTAHVLKLFLTLSLLCKFRQKIGTILFILKTTKTLHSFHNDIVYVFFRRIDGLHPWGPTLPLGAKLYPGSQLHPLRPTSPLGANFTPWGQLHPLGPTSPFGATLTLWGQPHPLYATFLRDVNFTS